MPLFYVVTAERHGLDLNAIMRAAGLEALLGNATIANIMGPDEALTRIVADPVKFMICEECSTDRITFAAAVENASSKAEDGK